MFEEQLTGLLASYLGQILDIQQDQLNVNVWTAWKTGLTLEDVPLRQGVALIPLPGLTLVGGKIGCVQISVPWRSLMLKSTPMVISLKDVEIVLGMEDDVSGDAARERYIMEKRALLAAQQLKHVAQASLDAAGAKEASTRGSSMLYSFIKHALSLVLGRLSITINNVSIRLIDVASQEDILRFNMDSMETIEKALMFHFQDTKTYMISSRNQSIVDVADGILRHGVSKNFRFSGVQLSMFKSDDYLMDTDFNVKLFYDITSSPSQLLLTMEFETFHSCVDMDAVDKLLEAAEYAEWTSIKRRVAHLKPVSTFDPKSMWTFAVNSVLLDIYGPLKFSVWKPERERVHDRRRYTLLYRKKIEKEAERDRGTLASSSASSMRMTASGDGEETRTPDEIQQHRLLSAIGEKQLSILEETMSISDILACRSAAKTSLMRTSISSPNFEILDVDKNVHNGSPTESCWMKIPTLADMEELFKAVDFTPDSETDAISAGFDIQILSMIRMPLVECRVCSLSNALDVSMTVGDIACGLVNKLDGNMYAMGSIQWFSLTTPRNSRIEPKASSSFASSNRGDPCLDVHYNGEENILQVNMLSGLCAQIVLDDIESAIQSIRVPSCDSYSLHWMQSAIEMEKYAYCLETMERLQKVGNFLNIDMAMGPAVISIGDFELNMKSLKVRSSKESNNLQDLRHTYELMRSLLSSIEARESAKFVEVVRESVSVLKERLIYKDVEITISDACITHNNSNVLHPLEIILAMKMNRLFGDFSNPQLMLDFSLGAIMLDVHNSALVSLMEARSNIQAPKKMPSDKRIDEATSICIAWPRLQVRWLDSDLVDQLSIISGNGRLGVQASSMQIKRNISASIDDFQFMYGKEMESVRIPILGQNIPYFARTFCLDRIVLNVVQLPCSTKLHMNSSGISLTGDEKDPSNFIKSSNLSSISSIEVTFADKLGDGISAEISVCNIDIGHGTVFRSFIASQVFTTAQEHPQMERTKKIAVKFNGQNLRCSFVDDKNYSDLTLPMQYQDFSTVHPTIARINLSKISMESEMAERVSLKHLMVESLSMYCGLVGDEGDSLYPIFQMPQITCDLNSGKILLQCPRIEFSLHPYQMMLLKGISQLIKFEGIRLKEFYGKNIQNSEELIARHEVVPSLEFDPISIRVDEMRLGILAPLPSAGALCLESHAVMIDIQPGTIKTEWDSLEIRFYQNETTDSDSLSDGSSVHISVPVTNDSPEDLISEHSRRGSSLFFDATSVASKSFSDSSFVSKYYSVNGEDVLPIDDAEYQRESNVHQTCLDSGASYCILSICFDSSGIENRGASLCMLEKHAKIKISPVKFHVCTSDLAQTSQFYQTYRQYFSDDSSTDNDKPQTMNNVVLLREVDIDLQSLIVCLESKDGDQSCDTFEDNSLKGHVDFPSASHRKRQLHSTIEMKFNFLLRYANGNVGQRCSAQIRGFLITSFSRGKRSVSIHSDAIFGNQEFAFNMSWKQKDNELSLLKCDISFEQISIWLNDRNIPPCLKVLSQLQSCLEVLKVEDTSGNDGLGNVIQTKAISKIAQVTIMISLSRLSVSCSQHAFSDQIVYLCELCLNDFSFVAHYTEGIVHGSASVTIQASTSNLTDGLWMNILEDTKVKSQFVLPNFSSNEITGSDVVRLDLEVEEANFTVNSNIINSLSISQMVLEKIFDVTQGLDAACYITQNEIVNETECSIEIQIVEATKDGFCLSYVVEPGGRVFPRQNQSQPYKSGYPDDIQGMVDLEIANRRDKTCDLLMYFKLLDGDHDFLGPLHMRTKASLQHNVSFHRQDCTIISLTSNSSLETWVTFIRPSIRFWNNTDFDIIIKYQKLPDLVDGERTVEAKKQQQFWLPVTFDAGYYRFITKRGGEISNCTKTIYLDPGMLAGDQSRHDIISSSGAHPVSISLAIKTTESSVTMTASPIFGIENDMPVPVHISSNLGTTWDIEPRDSTFSTELKGFPLTLRVAPLGYSESKSIVLDTFDEKPCINWADVSLRDCSDLLDVSFESHAPGKNEIFTQLQVSKNLATGTYMLHIILPIWIYNYSGIPISFDCLLDSDHAAQMELVLEDRESVLDDIVPDTWIPPLKSAETNTSISARSLRSSAYFSEQSLEGMDIDSDCNTPGQELAHRNFGDGSCEQTHASILGLGSLAQDQAARNTEQDSDSNNNLVRHSFSGLISPNQSSALKHRPTLPTGPNLRGFSILKQPSKKFMLRFSRQKARPGSTYWSSTVVLDSHRRFEAIDVPLLPLYSGIHSNSIHQGSYPVIAAFDQELSSFGEKRIEKLIISPRFVLVNQLGTSIQYKQQGTPIEFRVLPGDCSPVHWANIGLPKKLSIRIQQAGWMWSGGFSLDHAGDLFLKLRHRDRGITKIVRADISHSAEHGTEKIILRSNPEEFTPYRLENCSLETLTIRQKGVLDQQDILKPYCCINYTWDEPSLSHNITIECPGGLLVGRFDLDKVGLKSSVSLKDRLSGRLKTLSIFIHAEGPLKVLTIFDQEFHDMSQVAWRKISRKRRNNDYEFNCNLNALSLSCIHRNRERLFFILKHLSLSCFISPSRKDISGHFRTLRIENTSMSCIYPVVFCLPAPESELTSRVRRGVEGGTNPVMWELSIWRKGPEHNIICFEVADLSLRSFAIYIEQDLLNLLGELSDAKTLILSKVHNDVDTPRKSSSFLNLDALKSDTKRYSVEKYYFDRISISPMEIAISFNSSIERDWNNLLLQQFLALADIEDARMWLSGVLLKNALFDQQSIFAYLSSHYRRSLILELFKLVGAANVLGDPLALLQHISLGFWEFLSFPAMGLVESATKLTPSGLIMGFVQGTKGLLQNFLFAISNAATKASSAAHKAILLWGYGNQRNGIAEVSLVFPYNGNINSVEESLVGATLRGLVGLVIDPIRGAEEAGFRGFLYGLRHGAFGAVLIPASACLQMCASTALSIRRAVAGTANIGWSRPPRWVSSNNGTLPYNRNDSMGRWLFFQMTRNSGWMEIVHQDQYRYCSRISSLKDESEEYLILTDKKVLIVQACGMNWIPRLVWMSKISKIEQVKMEKKSIMIISNPELIKTSIIQIKEDRKKLYSVYFASFDSEDTARALFCLIENGREHIDNKMPIWLKMKFAN